MKSNQKNVSFSGKKIARMINQCFPPNDHDGIYYEASIIAGPFVNEIQARNVAKICSANDTSDEQDCLSLTDSKRKKQPHVIYSPEIKKHKQISTSEKDFGFSMEYPLPSPPLVGDNESNLSQNKTAYLEPKNNIYDKPVFESTSSICDEGLNDTGHIITNFLNEANNTEDFSSDNVNMITDNDNITYTNLDAKCHFNEHSMTSVKNSTPSSSRDSENTKLSCCCKNISDLKLYFESRDKQLMIQMMMLNNSNIKLCKAVDNMDKKLVNIMKADSRIRAMATPLPNIPPAFMGILPARTMDELKTVENLLSDSNEEAITYKEELKFYLLMKVGGMSFNSAIRKTIDSCFEKELLSEFSYKGKTKVKFISLRIFSVIYDSLSSYRQSPEDENKFHSVADNYIRHAPYYNKEGEKNNNLFTFFRN